MKFATVRELQINASRILKKVRRGEDVIVTRNGKPEAALTNLSEDALEEFVVLRHPTLLKELRTAYHEYLKAGGITQEAMRQRLKARRGKR